MPDSLDRFLPPGFPLPDEEAVGRLRANILREVRTPHPPAWGELAVIVAADEAGVDLSAFEPEAIWTSSSDERAPIFEALGQLLGERLEAR